MNTKHLFSIFLSIVFLIVGVFPQGVHAQEEEPQQVEGKSPFQESLQQYLAERAAAGEPVPSSVVYEYEVAEPVQAMSMRSLGMEEPNDSVTITATTTLVFDNPQQAGYEEWPSLDTENSGTNLDEMYYKKMEESFPGYWDLHEYGQEPRQETYVETFTLNSPAPDTPYLENSATSTTGAKDILLGFTYAGPSIDFTLKYNQKSCFLPEEKPWWWLGEWNPCVTLIDIKAGFQLEFAFGLRLPAEVTLNGPGQMQLGTAYDFSATLNPQDWSTEKYTLEKVVALDGKEYVLKAHYFLGVDVTVMDINVCEAIDTLSAFSCSLQAGVDQYKDFGMPFGTGNPFPLEDIDIVIKEIGLSELYKNKTQKPGSTSNTDGMNDEEKEKYYNFLDNLLSVKLGIGIRPEITSTKITAQWSTDCAGTGQTGQISFSQPNQPVMFSVAACKNDAAETAKVQLSDFRYYFNQFGVNIDAFLKLEAIGAIKIPIRLDLVKIDLSKWTEDTELYLDKHRQCQLIVGIVEGSPVVSSECTSAGPTNELILTIPTMDLVPPTSSISPTGTFGNNGWYTSDVTVKLESFDNLPECADAVSNIQYWLNGGEWTDYTDPFMLRQEGLTSIDYYAVDDAGNIEIPQTEVVKIDKTPPTLSAERFPTPNSYGWNRTDVTVQFEAVDAVSGVDVISPEQTFSQEGIWLALGFATDMAGNRTEIEVTDIKIDKTPPILTVTSPQAGNYPNTSMLTISWVASDALSGIANETSMMDGQPVQQGEVIDLLLVSAGSHPFNVSITDKADNVSQSSVPVFITVDINGLIAAKNKVCSLGWVNKPGTCISLGSKLEAAKKSIEQGKQAIAVNQLNAFINEVAAQKGKAVNDRAFNLLKTDALYIISQLTK